MMHIGSGIAGSSYLIATFPIKYATSKTKRLEIAISHEMTNNFILFSHSNLYNKSKFAAL